MIKNRSIYENYERILNFKNIALLHSLREFIEEKYLKIQNDLQIQMEDLQQAMPDGLKKYFQKHEDDYTVSNFFSVK